MIVDAFWTATCNMLVIECCGRTFAHRADRWRVRCLECRTSSHLGQLREEYAARPG